MAFLRDLCASGDSELVDLNGFDPDGSHPLDASASMFVDTNGDAEYGYRMMKRTQTQIRRRGTCDSIAATLEIIFYHRDLLGYSIARD